MRTTSATAVLTAIVLTISMVGPGCKKKELCQRFIDRSYACLKEHNSSAAKRWNKQRETLLKQCRKAVKTLPGYRSRLEGCLAKKKCLAIGKCLDETSDPPTRFSPEVQKELLGLQGPAFLKLITQAGNALRALPTSVTSRHKKALDDLNFTLELSSKASALLKKGEHEDAKDRIRQSASRFQEATRMVIAIRKAERKRAPASKPAAASGSRDANPDARLGALLAALQKLEDRSVKAHFRALPHVPREKYREMLLVVKFWHRDGTPRQKARVLTHLRQALKAAKNPQLMAKINKELRGITKSR